MWKFIVLTSLFICYILPSNAQVSQKKASQNNTSIAPIINPSTFSKKESSLGVNNISFLTGNEYELGNDHRNTLRFDHASTWALGDNYLFFDVTDPVSNDTFIYGEWHSRLSFSKMTGHHIGFGPVSDTLLAGELNFDGQGTHIYLYGVGFNIKIPEFQFVILNAYARRDPAYHGTTYQISWAWGLPFKFGDRVRFAFGGFCDYAGKQGRSAANFLAKPQLLFDMGNLLFRKPNNIFAGMRYVYWHNKLGIKGLNESVPELMITWQIT